jgi:hypothetical protein
LISPEMKYFSAAAPAARAASALARHQLEDQQRRDEAVVGVEVVAEVVVPGDLAAEDGVVSRMPLLKNACPTRFISASLPYFGGRVLHRVAGAHVVDDLLAGALDEERPRAAAP